MRHFFLVILVLFGSICFFKLIELESSILVKKEIIDNTPTISFLPSEENSDLLVFVAHGFAGSASFMKPIAISLAKTGHHTITFDFLGHGRHLLPYSGNIMTEDGATKMFVNQISALIQYYLRQENKSKAIIIGHSMASDLIFRAALQNENIIGSIGISNYTDVITRENPSNTLIINGIWEPSLRSKAVEILKSIGITNPQEDVLYGSFRDGSARQISTIQNADHVGILYSTKTQKAVNDWINQITENELKLSTNNLGMWALLSFVCLFLLFIAVIQYLPKNGMKLMEISFGNCFGGNIMALILTPLLLYFYLPNWSPFTSQNYLINHFLLYALLASLFSNAGIKKLGLKDFNLAIFTGLIVFFLFGFGSVLDRYVSTFYLSDSRVGVFFLLLFGCIPITFYIQSFYQASQTGTWKAAISKISLLLSLALAIGLNLSELFLLGYAILLLCAFWLVFGFLGHLLLRRIGSSSSIGFANAITLSWTLAIAIPLYSP